jgi:hypothetical protein
MISVEIGVWEGEGVCVGCKVSEPLHALMLKNATCQQELQVIFHRSIPFKRLLKP